MTLSFSVIVPIHNCQNSVVRTLPSIERSIQSFCQNSSMAEVMAEVIVVNNASRDRVSLTKIRPRSWFEGIGRSHLNLSLTTQISGGRQPQIQHQRAFIRPLHLNCYAAFVLKRCTDYLIRNSKVFSCEVDRSLLIKSFASVDDD